MHNIVAKINKMIHHLLFIYSLNDLVTVDGVQFYTTSMYHWTPLEVLLQYKAGKILFYDGKAARVVSSGHFLANGINVSPDKK